MATWTDFETAAPELAAHVRERLLAHKHLTIATIRKDGSPRISGTEIVIDDGALWIGSMPNALKAKDLRRDPRFALHSGSDDPSKDWAGDAKVAGVAREVPTEDDSHRFDLDLTEASWVRVNDDQTHLLIDIWTADGGLKHVKRK